MNAFLNHFSFEFRTGIRNKTLLLMNYLFPLGFYTMMGLLMTGINPAFRETMIRFSRDNDPGDDYLRHPGSYNAGIARWLGDGP